MESTIPIHQPIAAIAIIRLACPYQVSDRSTSGRNGRAQCGVFINETKAESAEETANLLVGDERMIRMVCDAARLMDANRLFFQPTAIHGVHTDARWIVRRRTTMTMLAGSCTHQKATIVLGEA